MNVILTKYLKVVRNQHSNKLFKIWMSLDGKKLQKLVVLHAKCKSCTSTSNFFPTVDIAVCLLNDKT